MADLSGNALRRNYLFTGLSDGEFSRILKAAKPIRCVEGQRLFDVGDKARHFYLVQSGQIQLYRLSAWGEEKVIELINPGQTFAEAVMFFKRIEYPVSAKAVLESCVWRIDMNVYLAILNESTEACFHLLGDMSRRLHGAIQDIEQLTLANATVRVIHLLLESVQTDQHSRCMVEWETPKQILASRLSVRPETFSRILHQLSRRGLISVSGKSIELIDLDGLRQLITGAEVSVRM